MSDSNRRERDQTVDQGFTVLAAILLCCLVVGFLSYSVGRDAERDTQRTTEYQNYGEQRQRVFCATLQGNLLTQCEMEQARTAREEYKSERDLEAQRDMSLWALAVFVISCVTTALTLWALFYVRGTLLATREALDDTGNATKAMIRQNEISEAAQRPWLRVTVRPQHVQCFGQELHIAYALVIENIGKSAAKNIRYYSNVWYVGEIAPLKVYEYLDARHMSAEPILDFALIPGEAIERHRIDRKILPGTFLPFEPEQAHPLFPLLHVRCFYDWGETKNLETTVTFQIGTRPKPGQMTPGPFLDAFLCWPFDMIALCRQPPHRII